MSFFYSIENTNKNLKYISISVIIYVYVQKKGELLMQKPKAIPKPIFALLLILVCLFLLLTFKELFPDQDNNSNTQNMIDTTPPTISCNISTKTVLPGEILTIDKLGIRATDTSPIESIAFTKMDDIEFFSKEFSFSYGGIYELTITACDIYKNKSNYTLTIKVETPPDIKVPSNFYVAAGSDIDFSKYIQVSDLLDETFTYDNLNIDTSNLNIATPGNYPVTFSGTDSYGLTSAKSTMVHILSKDDLQKQIDSQKIDISTSVIIGAQNAYDIGSYSDIASLESAIAPALVTITNEKNNITGDGCIIKIDDSFVTIVTNESVVTGNLTVCVSFFDETTRHAAVVFTNEEYNLAFIRIPVDGATEDSSVSSEYTRSLRTVHLDEQQWDMHPVTKSISLEQMLRHYELVFKHKLKN